MRDTLRKITAVTDLLMLIAVIEHEDHNEGER
jgi:hypothetical protein